MGQRDKSRRGRCSSLEQDSIRDSRSEIPRPAPYQSDPPTWPLHVSFKTQLKPCLLRNRRPSRGVSLSPPGSALCPSHQVPLWEAGWLHGAARGTDSNQFCHSESLLCHYLAV